jgi:V-type H+-transporting ATPase subunit a
MSLFRSDPMGYYSIVMPRENAWEIFNELGELSALQFIDLNAGQVAFNRPYSNYVQRCSEMENKL